MNALAPIIKAERMLAEAKTLDEILHVENLAQRARDFAKAAGMGRTTMNTAAKIMLDARRKAGDTVRTMQKRGELASQVNGRPRKVSQAVTHTLADLGLGRMQSSRYQQEASVPEKKYHAWVKKVCESDQGELSAAGLRSVARENGSKPTPKAKTKPFRKVAAQLRQAVARAYDALSEKERQILPSLLLDMAGEYKERVGGK